VGVARLASPTFTLSVGSLRTCNPYSLGVASLLRYGSELIFILHGRIYRGGCFAIAQALKNALVVAIKYKPRRYFIPDRDTSSGEFAFLQNQTWQFFRNQRASGRCAFNYSIQTGLYVRLQFVKIRQFTGDAPSHP
jgi:hypothetical protein